jgi:hypothetical protein
LDDLSAHQVDAGNDHFSCQLKVESRKSKG